MEKAWIDFKTDEETFKLIMKYEEEFVSDIMKKKYGKDFDGIQVKSSIKRSDIYKYTLAELLIKFDIRCIEKLKAKNKNVVGYLENPTDLMSRKLCLVYDLKPIDLEDIITHISSECRDVFVYTFGINRKKIKMSVIVSMFSMDTKSIYKNLISAIREFDSIAKDRKNRVIISNQKSGKVKSFITQTPNNNFDSSNVVIPKDKFNLIKFYEEKGYTVKEFIEAYRSLNLSDQELIKREFDRNFNEINNFILANEEKEKIYLLTKSENDGIGKLLKQIKEKEEEKDTEEITKNKDIKRKNPMSKYQTLNDYYKCFGIPEKILKERYKKLTKVGRKYFSEYIDVIENDDKQIFRIIKPITKEDYSTFRYFTKILLNDLLKDMKLQQNSSELVECVSEQTSVNENDELSCQQTESLEIESHTDILSFADVKDAIIDYIKMLKETNIISKDLIINLHLPKKYEYFLLTEFNLNDSNEFSLEEQAEFLNMNLEELCKNLLEAIISFTSSLNDRLTLDKQKLASLLAINNPSDDGETSIKKNVELIINVFLLFF